MVAASYGQCVSVTSNGVNFIFKVKRIDEISTNKGTEYSYEFYNYEKGDETKRRSARLAQSSAGKGSKKPLHAVDCESGNILRGGRRSTRRSKRSRRARTRRQ